MTVKYILFSILSLILWYDAYGQNIVIEKNPKEPKADYILRETRNMELFKSDSLLFRVFEVPVVATVKYGRDEIWYDLYLTITEYDYPEIIRSSFNISTFDNPHNYSWDSNKCILSLDYVEDETIH